MTSKHLDVPQVMAHPPAPVSLEETGLTLDLLLQLTLKHMHFAGELTGSELARRLGLRFTAIEPAVHALKSQHQIAIIGAGPAGLSAAGRAAARDKQAGRSSPSYILLEGFNAHAKTIQRYQKGKHVMAEPGFLDLRSDLTFGAGSRERVLGAWGTGLQQLGINIRHGAEVKRVAGAKGAFTIQLSSGETLQAAHVVLAIGLEGNPRKIGAPGEDLERVQYQLDDPAEFRDETILEEEAPAVATDAIDVSPWEPDAD